MAERGAFLFSATCGTDRVIPTPQTHQTLRTLPFLVTRVGLALFGVSGCLSLGLWSRPSTAPNTCPLPPGEEHLGPAVLGTKVPSWLGRGLSGHLPKAGSGWRVGLLNKSWPRITGRQENKGLLSNLIRCLWRPHPRSPGQAASPHLTPPGPVWSVPLPGLGGLSPPTLLHTSHYQPPPCHVVVSERWEGVSLGLRPWGPMWGW